MDLRAEFLLHCLTCNLFCVFGYSGCFVILQVVILSVSPTRLWFQLKFSLSDVILTNLWYALHWNIFRPLLIHWFHDPYCWKVEQLVKNRYKWVLWNEIFQNSLGSDHLRFLCGCLQRVHKHNKTKQLLRNAADRFFVLHYALFTWCERVGAQRMRLYLQYLRVGRHVITMLHTYIVTCGTSLILSIASVCQSLLPICSLVPKN